MNLRRAKRTEQGTRLLSSKLWQPPCARRDPKSWAHRTNIGGLLRAVTTERDAANSVLRSQGRIFPISHRDRRHDFSTYSSGLRRRRKHIDRRPRLGLRNGHLLTGGFRRGPKVWKVHPRGDSCDLVSDLQGASAYPLGDRKRARLQNSSRAPCRLRRPEGRRETLRRADAKHADYLQGR